MASIAIFQRSHLKVYHYVEINVTMEQKIFVQDSKLLCKQMAWLRHDTDMCNQACKPNFKRVYFRDVARILHWGQGGRSDFV